MEILQIKAIEANPELIETYKLVVWFLISFLGVMVVIIGFFFKREIFNKDTTFKSYDQKFKDYTEKQDLRWKEFTENQDKQINELKVMVSTVCSNVQNMTTMVEVVKQLQADRDPRIEHEIREHERRLNSHSQEIIYIKAKMEKKGSPIKT